MESILKEVQGFSQTQDEDHGESSSSSELHKYVSFEHPVLKNVVMVSGSGPHAVQYKKTDDSPLKEVVVSRKCAESVLRGAQVYKFSHMSKCLHPSSCERNLAFS